MNALKTITLLTVVLLAGCISDTPKPTPTPTPTTYVDLCVCYNSTPLNLTDYLSPQVAQESNSFIHTMDPQNNTCPEKYLVTNAWLTCTAYTAIPTTLFGE